ncbi:MAG TPA: endonuclease III [Actinomycetota bacterium]|nr:endonuclease III [Actinomycetota bacterium]
MSLSSESEVLKPSRPPRPKRTDPAERRFPILYRRLAKAYPDARCALNFSNPHEMLFATILSAQCTDAMVNKVTEKLFRKYPTLEDYAAADITELQMDVKPTGFFRQKSKNLQAAARKILDEFSGQVPSTMEELTTIPGAARKTANIVLGNAFGKVVGIAVDTHVRRVSQRLGLTANEDPIKIEQDLMALVPKSKWFKLSYLFIEHGRAVCKAPIPKCAECVLSDLCPSSRV